MSQKKSAEERATELAALRARTEASLPKFEYDPEGTSVQEQPKYACDRLRWQLRACLLQSDCCAVERKSPKQCLAERHPSVPDECQQLKHSFISCKRSMIDPRSRFRGRKGDHR